MKRRTFFELAGVLGLCPLRLVAGAEAQPAAPRTSLLSAPMELAGVWGASPPEAVSRVLSRARHACLSGLTLRSDRQPDKIRIDNHADGPPAIWLHDDPRNTAWIIVDVGPLDWSKLAYQFGHELGHVLCNSWDRLAKPRLPTQWLEEAMVEAFSIRGLGRLAAGWERNPPFAGDAGFSASLRQYRGNIIENCAKATEIAPGADIDSWFRAYRTRLERGRSEPVGAAVLGILTLLESDAACVEDLGALNRWPSRSGVPIEDYLVSWEQSCAEIGTSGLLPVRLRSLFHLS